MSPILRQDYQFEVMVEKMEAAIQCLKNTVILKYLIYLAFNVHIMKLVYFGCRIVELNKRQVEILKHIYKEVIAKKIGLGKKFPRKILYARKTVLGVGLISLSMAVKIQALKLYI